ncbi:MAG: GNAT family N-acetyltransferase [Thermoplasmata archaeon]|nr:GNAT family N-acetyltransferase [Thermoplasmata archaeon]
MVEQLRLAPIPQEEYDAWWKLSVREYADEHVKSGNWDLEGALEKSEGEFQKLLPEGMKTAGHYLYSLEHPDGHEHVGIIWFRAARGPDAPRPPVLFIYDLLVYESFRGKGYGKQAMGLIEGKARELGFDTVSLHVFGHNRVALSLYQKLGYVATNLLMSKKVERGPASQGSS